MISASVEFNTMILTDKEIFLHLTPLGHQAKAQEKN